MINTISDAYNLENLKKLEVKELPIFAEQVRRDLIDIVGETGGHLGVNLAVLELTIALHYVFDFPTDNLIFDTGHNCYIHKMLTGRLNSMRSMRTHGGLSGFPSPKESEFDLFSSSHAGMALSLGLGVAMADKMAGRNNITVVVVGDAALVEGSSQEALNHIGVSDCRLLIVVNDNGMAIDEWDGGIKGSVMTYWGALGLEGEWYKNGHNIEGIVGHLTGHWVDNVRHLLMPRVLHFKTEKSHGLLWGKDSPQKNHWVFPYEKDGTPKSNESFYKGKQGDTVTLHTLGLANDYRLKPTEPFLNSVAADTIYSIVKEDKKAVVVSPATNGISGIAKVFEDFPEQCFDVAMAEQHALGFATGLAKKGMKPIVCFQSAFLPRAFDQLIQEVALNQAPILMVVARSGFAGLDHEVHHAIMDLSYLTAVPGLRVLFPGHPMQIIETLKWEYGDLCRGEKGPRMILYPYGLASYYSLDYPPPDVKAVINIFVTGSTLPLGEELNAYLYQQGVLANVVNVVQLSPIDGPKFHALHHQGYAITLEENVLRGGLGSMVAEYIVDNDLDTKLMRVGIPDCFVEKGLREYLYPKLGMDCESIYARMKERWGL